MSRRTGTWLLFLSALGLLALVLAWLRPGTSDRDPRPVAQRPTASVYATPSDPTTVDQPDPSPAPIPLERPATRVLIRGRVLDAIGGPVEGAQVLVRGTDTTPFGYATSDDAGWFTVHDRDTVVRYGAIAWISVSADGYATTTVATTVPITTIELTLIPTSTVAGVVVTEAGDPVPGVLVELRPPPLSLLPSWPQARSDGEGRFEIGGVGPGRYRPTIEDGPWLAEHPGVDVLPLTRHDDVRVVAEAGEPLTVRVLAPDGSPCPDPRAWMAGLRRRGRAGSDTGEWLLASLPAGEHEVHATCPNALEVAGTVTLPTDEVLTLRTEAGLTVEGRVVDELGVPVPDAKVRLVTSGRDHATFTTRTDARGQFELAGLAPGRYHADASHEKFQAGEHTPVALAEDAPAPFVELPLTRGQCLQVLVRGLAGSAVVLAHAPPGLPVRQHTHADGTAELCGFADDARIQLLIADPLGNVRIPFARDPRDLPDSNPGATASIELAGPAAFDAPVQLDVEAARDRAIEVHLDGNAEALVVLVPVDANATPNCEGDSWAIEVLAQGITIAGVRRFEGLWPGRYLVRANHEGRRDCAVVELDERYADRAAVVELRVVEP